MLVLHYIASKEKRFQTYVENRVSVSTPQQWRYVPSAENPADDLSRGLTATEMIENERWFSGPSFLRKEESAWPAKPKLKPETLDNDPEIRKSEKCMAVKETPVSVMDLLIDRRSSWYRLKKDVAWFIRFQKWIKFKYGGKQLKVED